VAEHLAECLAAIDRIEDLPPNGGGQPPLRSGSAKRSLCVAVSLAAEFTAAAAVQAADVPCAASFTRGTLAGLYRPPWPDLVLAGHRFRSQSPWLDLILADGQRFGSQPRSAPWHRSSPRADRVIPQLEPLAGDFNELLSVVGLELADVIEATRKHLMVEIEAATNHLVCHQHHVVVIDDLPPAMTLDAELQVNPRIGAAA
jgi:hypothetical protein